MGVRQGRLIVLLSAVGMLAACGGADQSAPAGPGSGVLSDPAGISIGAQLSAVCSGCHTDQITAIASLDGLSQRELQTRFAAYAEDEVGTTVMHRIARGYTPSEIDAIAAYLGESGADE
ncbi:MAG: hypothetical protein AAFO63_03365 [Pseudomonadota bacterium]